MTLYIRNVRGNEDDPGDALAEGWSLMQWVNGEIAARFPGRITIAEDLRNKAALTARGRGGRRRLRRAVGRAVRPSDPRGADRARRRAPAHGARSPTRSATTTTAIRSSG